MVMLGRRAVLAAGLVVVEAPGRQTQADAGYQPRPRDGLTCEACTFFRRPRSCQVVEGDISPDGWCKLFDMPD